MASHLRPCLLVLLLLAVPRPALAQLTETFSFPQTHDTAFGTNLFLGPFFWFADGDGVKGRRVSSQGIASLEAFGFNLFLGLSCIANPPEGPVHLDVYVNDRLLGSAAMPSFVVCNSPGGLVQGQFAVSPPIAGLGAGAEYEFRLQLRGSASPIEHLLVFYAIDTSNSTVAISGSPAPPPPPPPPPDLSHTDITNQIQQSEGNIINGQNNALAAVRNALGVVEGNLNASIAGAVLNVNSATALGIDRLATQIGVQGGDLAMAIKGNGTAIANVQRAIEDRLLPEIQNNRNAIRDVGINFLDKLLGQALSTGGRILDFYAGSGILKVADFVKRSINLVIESHIRPDRIVRRAVAEFNRGLRRLRNIFRSTDALAAVGGEQYADLLAANLPGGDESDLGPDTEDEDVFGAYVWFERAYQTLVKGQANNRPLK